jgi:hypothetical protein
MLMIRVLAVVVALALPVSATAGNAPHSTLDNAASFVAGKPVSVYCEYSWSAWLKFFADRGRDGSTVNGYTNINSPVVYVSPAVCETLHGLIGQRDIGAYHAALALLTLAHEAQHQRGVLDEGAADCAALAQVGALAVSYFGIPATVQTQRIVVTQEQRVVTVDEQRVVPTSKRVRRNGKWVVVRGTRVVTVPVERTVTVDVASIVTESAANPWLARLAEWALWWHRAAGPAYQGNC